MSLFQCSACGCLENTALSGCYHIRSFFKRRPEDGIYEQPGLVHSYKVVLGLKDEQEFGAYCSACNPVWYTKEGRYGFGPRPADYKHERDDSGKWHGQFERTFLPKGMFHTNDDGNLAHVLTLETDYSKYRLEAEDSPGLHVGHPEECRMRHRRIDENRSETISGPSHDVHWPSVVHEEVKPCILRPSDLAPRYGWGYRNEKPTRNIMAERIAGVRAFLDPEHKKLVAGAPCGSQLTPWKMTLLRVTEFLRVKGPSSIAELVAGVEHHYGNMRAAKGGIYRMIAEIKKNNFVKVDDTRWGLAPEEKPFPGTQRAVKPRR